jgi:hypothetical protein
MFGMVVWSSFTNYYPLPQADAQELVTVVVSAFGVHGVTRSLSNEPTLPEK